MNAKENIQQESKKTGLKEKSNFFRVFSIYAVIILLITSVVYFLICSKTYSEGTRMGVLYKISRKGYIFKTYEGEIHIGGMYQTDGKIMPPSVFKFSVKRKDKLVYHKLDSLQGQKVVVKYKQVIKSFFWQGETDYFVYDGKISN